MLISTRIDCGRCHRRRMLLLLLLRDVAASSTRTVSCRTAASQWMCVIDVRRQRAGVCVDRSDPTVQFNTSVGVGGSIDARRPIASEKRPRSSQCDLYRSTIDE